VKSLLHMIHSITRADVTTNYRIHQRLTSYQGVVCGSSIGQRTMVVVEATTMLVGTSAFILPLGWDTALSF
jgi:hypothetical protein